jgi:hypothetical protein
VGSLTKSVYLLVCKASPEISTRRVSCIEKLN